MPTKKDAVALWADSGWFCARRVSKRAGLSYGNVQDLAAPFMVVIAKQHPAYGRGAGMANEAGRLGRKKNNITNVGWQQERRLKYYFRLNRQRVIAAVKQFVELRLPAGPQGNAGLGVIAPKRVFQNRAYVRALQVGVRLRAVGGICERGLLEEPVVADAQKNGNHRDQDPHNRASHDNLSRLCQ